MIEVKINLVPFGQHEFTKQIGYIKIWNDGAGNYEIGSYGYEIIDEDGEVLKSGKYKNFQRSKGVFVLINAVLTQLVECDPSKVEAEGSSPSDRSKNKRA